MQHSSWASWAYQQVATGSALSYLTAAPSSRCYTNSRLIYPRFTRRVSLLSALTVFPKICSQEMSPCHNKETPIRCTFDHRQHIWTYRWWAGMKHGNGESKTIRLSPLLYEKASSAVKCVQSHQDLVEPALPQHFIVQLNDNSSWTTETFRNCCVSILPLQKIFKIECMQGLF